MASASTSDHQPMPMQPTRSGPALTASSSRDDRKSAVRRRRRLLPARADRLRRPPWRCAASVSQSPPLTPTPPMHWPSTSTGTPPSMAVQRSGPAASARPMAWLTSRSWPTAPLAVVGRRLDAAHTALVVRGVHGVEAAAVHALEQDHVPAGIDDGAGDGDAGLAGHVDGGRHHLLGALVRQALALDHIHSADPVLRAYAEIVRRHAATIKEE